MENGGQRRAGGNGANETTVGGYRKAQRMERVGEESQKWLIQNHKASGGKKYVQSFAKPSKGLDRVSLWVTRSGFAACEKSCGAEVKKSTPPSSLTTGQRSLADNQG